MIIINKNYHNMTITTQPNLKKRKYYSNNYIFESTFNTSMKSCWLFLCVNEKPPFYKFFIFLIFIILKCVFFSLLYFKSNAYCRVKLWNASHIIINNNISRYTSVLLNRSESQFSGNLHHNRSSGPHIKATTSAL